MSVNLNFASLPNLKISCDSNHQSTEIRFIEDDEYPDIFPYRCTCKKDPCECGCSDISEGDIEQLFDSLEIESRDKALNEGVRMNTLHVWGTAELSSEDLLGFFAEYNPSTIEWINDDTCNVVFEKESSAFRALFNLSEPFIEEAIMVSSDESDNDADRAVERILSLAGEIPIVDYDDAENEEDGANMDVISPPQRKPKRRTAKSRLPTGKWRQGIGIPEKAEALFVRYANANDRKRFGAERESRYYQRHGNPNFGGVTGIITESYRRRMRQNTRRTSPLGENTRDVQIDGRTPVSYGELYPDSDSADGRDQFSEEDAPVSRPAVRTMRMIADEEEERKKSKSHSAVHARLGGRHRRLAYEAPPPRPRREREQEDFDVDLRVMLSRRDRSPISDSDSESSRSWRRERRRKQRRRSRSREERPRKSRLDGRLGPTNDELNPGSDFMRRRKDFYHHDDRSDIRTKGKRRERSRINDRWVNDKFEDLD